ncbi:MAG TPA: LacI family DNA-binding transcriptional regulator [Chloroflexota bacterium]|nr:LacI family DNA-binding transcriptional regulator [Chloroflexota bacterium]
MERAFSIHDVAERAGVSAATVSHVLNATRFVSQTTRSRVLTAIDELGYIPSAAARSLRSRRTRTLAFVVSDIENPFFTEVVRAAERRAAEAGYTAVLGNTDEELDRERAIVRTLLEQRVDGVLLAPVSGTSEQQHLRQLQERGVPLVLLNRRLPALSAPTVTADNATGSYELTRYALQQGHRRIGVIHGRLDTSTTQERLAGYRRALAEANVEQDDNLLVLGGSKEERACQAAQQLLTQRPRPTCLYAFNNLMTEGMLLAVREAGLACPEEVSLIGFDDFRAARTVTPALTVVAQPTYEIGRTATEFLLRLLDGEAVADAQLPTRLIVRESCAAPARVGLAVATAGGG